jgi:hypothetical protein
MSRNVLWLALPKGAEARDGWPRLGFVDLGAVSYRTVPDAVDRGAGQQRLFALVGGVLADILDRVKLLVAVLTGMAAASAALTALTAAHRMPPALLLTLTFMLGTGAILVAPADARRLSTRLDQHQTWPAPSARRSPGC